MPVPVQSSSRTVILPPELYGRVFDFVLDRGDLLSLCLVSREFHEEAERALYRYIDLSYDHRLIKEWFSMIALNPRLADMVRAVTFGMIYSQVPTPSGPWLGIIQRGLHTLTHLQELSIYLDSTTSLPPSYANIILGHPFRLKVFRNTMFHLSHTLSFLKSQPDIIIWDQPVAQVCNFPDDLLPQLAQASLAPWLIPKFKTCPLTEISTVTSSGDAVSERAFLDTLADYGRSLTRLCLERQTFRTSMTLRDFLLHLASCVPRLQHLSLWNRGELVADSSMQETVNALVHFKRLETLSFLPPRTSTKDSIYLRTLSNEKATASYFFRTISTLNRVAFPPKCPPHHAVWYARSLDAAMVGDTVIEPPKRRWTFRKLSLPLSISK